MFRVSLERKHLICGLDTVNFYEPAGDLTGSLLPWSCVGFRPHSRVGWLTLLQLHQWIIFSVRL